MRTLLIRIFLQTKIFVDVRKYRAILKDILNGVFTSIRSVSNAFDTFYRNSKTGTISFFSGTPK
jgi:uncharacterized membrane protein